MTAVEVFAPAKINLTLHVTGRRADGYHTLDSLVAFANFGDRLVLCRAAETALTVTGPFSAGVPAGGSNLVLRALGAMPNAGPFAVELEKHLPPASGIGGGSSDAAAALRGALAFDRTVHPPAPDALAGLGADLPMCLSPQPWRARGIGEHLTPVQLPELPAVLVNPGVSVGTPAVFAGLARRDNPGMPDALPAFQTPTDTAHWLGTQRNDLETAAAEIAPGVATVLDRLRALPGTLLARMSGSGATCFALFADPKAAQNAARSIANARPDWWVKEVVLGSQTARAAPLPLN